ncbi:S-adenosyl-L-methionine-dependent methyltransferase [Coniella lustricola]|uniref:tRNA(Phe) (4-demethylwyosine(37)-C(7)) aminocarboxypropyltransferase n=1 Tax=Coniella lustricola TaxID=2025994 RepID=A0A2T3A3P4_9PEZI|nr:S-adenosyl-L-methionine-dependent methyltransferase [Coniella lustricola]
MRACNASVGKEHIQAPVALERILDNCGNGWLVGGIELARVHFAVRVQRLDVRLVVGEVRIVKVANVDGFGAVLGELSQRPKRPPKPATLNPIAAAIQDWAAATLHSNIDIDIDIDIANLIAAAPKRWVVYEPMVLLPSGSFTAEPWSTLLASGTISQDDRDSLWHGILHHIAAKTSEETTHLAVNDGIPLTVTAGNPSQHTNAGTASSQEEEENILRSPVGLRILYGDFGPASTAGPTVTQADFDRAFWVSTRQNGIVQMWAPRWTMFSRGNVKEKARLHWAVDLYAGIGYFVFSYARLGMRVLAWELNPWSVEGLRRGARANGWTVKIIQGAEELCRPAHQLVSLNSDDGGNRDSQTQITVFLQDNREAVARVHELRNDPCKSGVALPVMHVNCGLLPRSDDSWAAARQILQPVAVRNGETQDQESPGWLHLHENVGSQDIEQRRAEIQALFRRWEDEAGGGRTAEIDHVELVKTFAPSVWHCVFDVCITTKSTAIKHEKKKHDDDLDK